MTIPDVLHALGAPSLKRMIIKLSACAEHLLILIKQIAVVAQRKQNMCKAFAYCTHSLTKATLCFASLSLLQSVTT